MVLVWDQLTAGVVIGVVVGVAVGHTGQVFAMKSQALLMGSNAEKIRLSLMPGR